MEDEGEFRFVRCRELCYFPEPVCDAWRHHGYRQALHQNIVVYVSLGGW